MARPVDFSAVPRDAWERLLAHSPAATPFARWTFHRAWWDAYGDTAHEQYLVCLPADEPRDGQDIRAIVPLMHRHEVEPTDIIDRTVLRQTPPTTRSLPADAKAVFFGASYHADYATILAAPADLPAVARALAEHLADPAPGAEPWDVVDLRRLRVADPALAALERALHEMEPGWQVIRETEDVCPVVSAPGPDWDEYLATLDKKARHEIRRKLRRAAQVGELSIAVSAPTAQAIDAFISLHQARFGERGLFADTTGGDRSRRFVHRLAELERSEPDGGQLQVGLMHCGERLVFAMLGFDDGQTCYLYNSGMDPAAADVSPGVTGLAEYLRNRMAAGRRRFDFLRGNEPYKYEWGARDEPIERLIVVRDAASPAGEVAA